VLKEAQNSFAPLFLLLNQKTGYEGWNIVDAKSGGIFYNELSIHNTLLLKTEFKNRVYV